MIIGDPKNPAREPDAPSHPDQAPGEQGIPVNAPPADDDPEPRPAADPNADEEDDDTDLTSDGDPDEEEDPASPA
jgi:hypothetical protein